MPLLNMKFKTVAKKIVISSSSSSSEGSTLGMFARE